MPSHTRKRTHTGARTCRAGLGMLGSLSRKLTEKEERALAAEQERAAKKQLQAAAKDKVWGRGAWVCAWGGCEAA